MGHERRSSTYRSPLFDIGGCQSPGRERLEFDDIGPGGRSSVDQREREIEAPVMVYAGFGNDGDVMSRH